MSAGSIIIDMLMRTGAFETDTKRAAGIAKRSAKDIEKSYQDMSAGVSRAVKGLAGLLTFREVTQAISAFARQGEELQKLSSLAGSTVEDFQRFAAASSTVGIEQEKLGDIFKDFREKVGEFVQTGGGGMKDFFEQIAPKVGVTAEAFRNLSGPQALQLYVDSLEKAGLSQEQMSFYLESMASDTTALIPLLRNGGAELGRLGDQAEKTGQIISTETVASAAELRSTMRELEGVLVGVRNTIAVAVLPALKDVLGEMREGIGIAGGFGEALRLFGTINPFRSVAGNIREIRDEIAETEKALAALDSRRMKSSARDATRANLESELSDLRKQKAFLESQQRTEALGVGDVLDPRDRAAVEVTTPTAPFKPPPAKTTTPKVTDLQRMTKALTDQAATFGLTAEAAELYRYKVAGASPAQLAFAAEVQGAATAFEKQAKALTDGKALTEKLRTPVEELAAEEAKLNLLLQAGAIDWTTYGRAMFEAQDDFTAAQKALEEAKPGVLELKAMLDATPTAKLKEMRADMTLLRDALVAGGISAAEFSEAAQTRLGTLPDKLKESTDFMKTITDQAARNMQDAFADFLFDPFADGVDGMLKSFGNVLRRMAAEAAAAQLFDALGSWGKSNSGSGGWVGAIASIAGAFGGARATGGPVASGMTYLVGEKGPELFRPGTSGAIVPNNQLRGSMGATGGMTVVQNINVGGGSAPDVRRSAGQGAREGLSFMSGAQRYA